MSRVLPLVLAVVMAQVVVSIAIAPSRICTERCADDDADGRCPPVCLSCAPAAHPAPPLSASPVVSPLCRDEVVLAAAIVLPREPDPGDIFHVPKRVLA